MADSFVVAFQTAYSKRKKVGVDCKAARAAGDVAQTVQADAEDCDINRLYDRYLRKGIVPEHLVRARGAYGDFTGVPDFQTAQNTIAQASELFAQVPAKLRRRFNDNPAEYLEFVLNPENKDELVKLGLARAADVSTPAAATPPAKPNAAPAGGEVAAPAGAAQG